jgi:MFS transporter, DHA1 family, multidrug resistance protein
MEGLHIQGRGSNVALGRETLERDENLDSWKRTLWILWFGVLLSSASYTMVVPFLPLYLLKLGVSEQTVNMWSGVIFSVSFLVGAFIAPYWGSLADKYGKRKMVIRAGLSLAIVYALAAIVRNPWELLAVRILQGLVSGFVPASMALVASIVPEEEMGYSLGVMQTAGATGGILGPLFGGILAEAFGMRLSFVISSIVILVGTIMVLLFVHEKVMASGKEQSRVWGDLKTAWHNKVFVRMLGLLVIFQISVMILQPLLTLYIAKLQGKMDGALVSSGIIFSLTGVAGIIAAPRWGRIGQKQGLLKILCISLFGAGILNSFQVLTNSVWQFSIVQFLYGLFLAGVLPSINTIVVENTDVDFRGRAFGLTTSANQMGSMIGPLIGGAIGSFFSISLVFIVTGFILIITGCYVAHLMSGQRQQVHNSKLGA